jgi:hypothetical protein
VKTLFFAAVLLAVTAPAAAANLITNGDFEIGTLDGWTLSDSGSGSWYVIGNGGDTALKGFGTPKLADGGNFVAMTDQTNPGSHNLSQTLTLSGGAFVLSFEARGNDQSNSGGIPEQQYIVTVDGNTVAGPIITSDWGTYTFDLNLSAGAHTFAFQENDNRNFYTAGLDNVSLTDAVPEAPTWAMLITGFGLVGAALRRRAVVVA